MTTYPDVYSLYSSHPPRHEHEHEIQDCNCVRSLLALRFDFKELGLTIAFLHPSGGGIGGLALAVALGKFDAAVEVDIYESTGKFSEVGAGIGMFARTWELMRTLGLEEDLKAIDGIQDMGGLRGGPSGSARLRLTDVHRRGVQSRRWRTTSLIRRRPYYAAMPNVRLDSFLYYIY